MSQVYFLTNMKRIIKQQVALQLFFIYPLGKLFEVYSELAETLHCSTAACASMYWENFYDDSAPMRAIIINLILIRRKEL